MYTVIAPTNFSEDSIHAVNYAADLAINLNADLLLLHVVQMPAAFDVPLTQYEYETILQDAEEELALLRNDLLLRCDNEINIATKAVFSTIENEITEAAEVKKPFIIVIGPERENAASRFFFGSNTLSVVKKQHYPVIVVPRNGVFKQIRRIGLATDLQDISEVPVESLRTLIEIFNANLDIIHVCKSRDDEAAAKACLNSLKLKLQEFNPEVHIVFNTDVEEGLRAYAEEHREDMMVVIPREHTLLHKSHTNQMARHSSVPLLAVS
ncbi:MAG TPA: universal stress protein [Chitinophagaceae bacterium]|nr:universal stress protein [Chitinophagaceae bacterium]